MTSTANSPTTRRSTLDRGFAAATTAPSSPPSPSHATGHGRAGPLRFFDGDVRWLPEAETLRLRNVDPHLAGLLERARVATKQRRYGEPLIVEERSAPPVEEYEPVGPIERSPWAGRVISVR